VVYFTSIFEECKGNWAIFQTDSDEIGKIPVPYIVEKFNLKNLQLKISIIFQLGLDITAGCHHIYQRKTGSNEKISKTAMLMLKIFR
jgi:hypothetical protein